ncbi:MAG: hypothetical protein WAM53_01675 [Terrimicrobiaceae bacterium]
MTRNQLKALNAELVDAIKRLLRNRIPHDNVIAYAKFVVVKAELGDELPEGDHLLKMTRKNDSDERSCRDRQQC